MDASEAPPRKALPAWVAARLHAALPAVLFDLRTAVAVRVALAIAFELELDQAYWAGTTAAIVCQPVLGSALRKAAFRMAGTLAGAVTAVLLFACFPQDRVGFTLAFAGWAALCCFVGSRLTFFATYGAMLAGYTTAIIVGDVIDAPDRVFDVALARVTEIELWKGALRTPSIGGRPRAEGQICQILTAGTPVPIGVPRQRRSTAQGCSTSAHGRPRT